MSTMPPRPSPRPHQPQQPLRRPPELTGPPPRRPSQEDPAPDGIVTRSTLLGAVLLTALVSTLLAAVVFTMVIDKGDEGPVGPRGIPGPTGEQGRRGERGRTNRDISIQKLAKAVEEPQVVDAIEDALQSQGATFDDGSTTGDDFGDSGSSPDPSELDQLRDEIGQVCDALRQTGNVGTADLPC